MIYVGVRDGVVELCTAVNSIADLVDYYPELTLMEQTGQETIGWTFDGTNFLPPVSDGQAGPTRVTKLAFENRFTDEEAIAIDLASLGSTALAAALRRAQRRISLAQYIDLEDPQLANGLGMLEELGLLATGRASTILTTPPAASELFRG